MLIILILAFLGFNIFVYLAKGTQNITNFFSPLLTKLIGITTLITGQTINMSAEGAKSVVNNTASVIDSGLSDVQNTIPTTKPVGQPIDIHQPPVDVLQQSTLNNALNKAQTNQTQNYESDIANSSIQGGGKAG